MKEEEESVISEDEVESMRRSKRREERIRKKINCPVFMVNNNRVIATEKKPKQKES